MNEGGKEEEPLTADSVPISNTVLEPQKILEADLGTEVDSTSEEKMLICATQVSSSAHDIDTPLRFAEKKRLFWAGKTCA